MNIPVEDGETRAIIWDRPKAGIDNTIEPEIVTMAKAAGLITHRIMRYLFIYYVGHEVLFTPPRYSDLQPIETVWAIVKSEVGRQYDDKTTIADVRERLELAFENLDTYQVQGCIKKTNQHI